MLFTNALSAHRVVGMSKLGQNTALANNKLDVCYHGCVVCCSAVLARFEISPVCNIQTDGRTDTGCDRVCKASYGKKTRKSVCRCILNHFRSFDIFNGHMTAAVHTEYGAARHRTAPHLATRGAVLCRSRSDSGCLWK